jgi:hypothetical protein
MRLPKHCLAKITAASAIIPAFRQRLARRCLTNDDIHHTLLQNCNVNYWAIFQAWSNNRGKGAVLSYMKFLLI